MSIFVWVSRDVFFHGGFNFIISMFSLVWLIFFDFLFWYSNLVDQIYIKKRYKKKKLFYFFDFFFKNQFFLQKMSIFDPKVYT